MPSKLPTYGNGKICYLELPALDVKKSAAFYQAVFGWQIRQRGDGATAFDDGVGEVSGAWVTGRKAAGEPGLMVYIMMDSIATTCEAILAHGGTILQPIGGDAPEITARFADPIGNVLGLYQEPVAESLPDREIVSTRVIRAQREVIWQAWTDPKHLAQWWGPSGFSSTVQEFDPRTGGHWKFIMHGPNSADYPNHIVFLGVTKPERITYDHISNPQFMVAVTFKEENALTKITFRMIFSTAEKCEKLKSLCVPSNEQMFDRLEAELKKMS